MNNLIFDRAEQLVRKLGSRDPLDALDYLRVKVMYTDRHPADGLKGFCTIALQTKYVMINSNLEEDDQAMVAAHELGHIQLHTSGSGLFTFREEVLCNRASKMERDANLFAVDFRISDKDMMDCIEAYYGDIFSAASELRVPVEFLSFKLFSMIQRGYMLRMPLDLDNRFLAKDIHQRRF